MDETTKKVDLTRADVTKMVTEIIADILKQKVESIKEIYSLRDDLGADSLEGVEIIQKFEDAFEIEISDEESEKIKKVADAINYICKLLNIQ